MVIRRFPFLFSLLLLLLTAFAFSGCHYPAYTSGSVGITGKEVGLHLTFTDYDRRVIRDYYGAGRRGLPPGLAKKHKVPPGHRRKLARHRPIPPGLRGRALPGDLHQRLSPLPKDYVRLKIGSDIVLFDAATQVVVDIVFDVD